MLTILKLPSKTRNCFENRTKEKHSTTSCVSPFTAFVLQPVPTCFTTEQSKVKPSLFFNKTSILNISHNSICLDHELCTNSLTPVSLQHKCKCFAFSVKRRQARGERLARVRCEGRSAKKYYYHYHFLVVLVAVAVAVMAKIVSTMQFAAHAKRNTLYGRSYGGKSKFFRLDG